MGIILSIVGLALLSYNEINGINLGDILTLICAFCFSARILLVDKFGGEVDPILLTILELFVVGILALIPSIFVDRLQITMNMVSIGAVVFTTVFCTALAMAVQNKMQHYTNPTHAAIIYLAEPVFGAIFSAFVGDILSGRTLLGCIIILFGMVILSVDPKLFERKTVMVENND